MKRLILTSLCLLFARGAFAWGQKGHDVTAYIAECRLTPEAAEKVRQGARTATRPSTIANWLDFASHWPEYAYSKTWHYLNIDEGETLETHVPESRGRRADGRDDDSSQKLKAGTACRPRRRRSSSRC